MIKNDIKIKQVCTIFLAFMPLIKIVSVPSILSESCKWLLWQPALIMFLLDIALILLLSFVIRKNNTTFFDALSENVSAGFAKLIYFIYAIFFLIKCFLPLLEHKQFIENALYEIMPHSIVFFPVFLVTFYISLKGLKVLGRCSAFCLITTYIGVFLVFYLSATSGNYETLLPIKLCNYKLLYGGFSKSIFWFNDAIYLFFFMGHFKKEGKTTLKLLISYAIGSLITLLFIVIFYSIFANVSSSQRFAVSSMSIFSVTLANVGRFDYIAIFLIIFSQIFAISIPIMLSAKCLERTFDTKSSLIPSIIVNTILLISTIVLANKFEKVLSFYQKYFVIFFILCGYILPFLSLLNCKKKSTYKDVL